MQYRYFECKCGHSFHAFVEPPSDNQIETYKTGVYKVTGRSSLPTYPCSSCGQQVELCLNDPDAAGTKLLFDYMER